MRIHETLCSVLLAAVTATSAGAARTKRPPTPSPEPTPTPTPAPRTPDDAAPALRLERIEGAREGEPLVITNADVEQLAQDGRLITAAVPTGEGAKSTPATEPADPAVRRRWRQRYMKQRRRIRKLQDELERAGRALRETRRAFPSVRNRERKDRIRAEIDRLREHIDREHAALNAIIREARKEGAQPGWFR